MALEESRRDTAKVPKKQEVSASPEGDAGDCPAAVAEGPAHPQCGARALWSAPTAASLPSAGSPEAWNEQERGEDGTDSMFWPPETTQKKWAWPRGLVA